MVRDQRRHPSAACGCSICSANVFLNLSGGVGRNLLKTGNGMQEELHECLRSAGRERMSQGDVVVTAAHGLSFNAVIHAVAVDAVYQSSPAVISSITRAGAPTCRVDGRTHGDDGSSRKDSQEPMKQFAAGIWPLLEPRSTRWCA